MTASAPASLPASRLVATGPLKKPSQNRRRAGNSGNATLTALRHRPAYCANEPSRSGSSASICVRTRRASVGELPAVPTATISGERSTIAGKMNAERAASSTTLTSTPRSRAARATAIVHGFIIGGGDDQQRALQLWRAERHRSMLDASECAVHIQIGAQLRRHHPHACVRLQQVFRSCGRPRHHRPPPPRGGRAHRQTAAGNPWQRPNY